MTNQSQWIWNASAQGQDVYVDFVEKFTGRQGQTYRLEISCDTDYTVWCNGMLAGFGQYGDYIDYKVYDVIDLSSYMKSGENELLITVWHTGLDSQTYIRKPAGLRYEVYEDGQLLRFSDEETLSRLNANYIFGRCEMISSQLGPTFYYDATKERGAFSASQLVEGLPSQLYLRPTLKLELQERLVTTTCMQGKFTLQGGERAADRMQNAALSPVEGRDGVFVILDMGSETAGFLDLDIEVPHECEIEIGWGEHLLDGRCRTAVRNFACGFRAKAGRNKYMNTFRRLGCRYIQLFIYAQEALIHYAGIRPTIYPLEVKSFNSGSLLRDRIYEVCINTLRQCMHEHYEDCPWREQALYTMDSRNQMLCGYYAFGETQFPRACLELISHGRRPDGLLSLCYPAGKDLPIPMFSLIYFVQMAEYLTYSGDEAFLREKYEFLQQLMGTFLTKPKEQGLIENFYGGTDYWNFYEWSEGMSGVMNEQNRSIEAPLNAFLSLALQHLAQISEKLGYNEDASQYEKEAAQLNRAIGDYFYDPKAKLFRSFNDRRREEYSVLTNSVCLLCGAADGLDKSNILKILEANGGTEQKIIPNTLSMNSFRFDALLKEDREKYAPMILAEIDQVYFDMLQQGATSFWETAVGAADFNNAGSLCHGWSALPVYYYWLLGDQR